jgi:WG containing repeat
VQSVPFCGLRITVAIISKGESNMKAKVSLMFGIIIATVSCLLAETHYPFCINRQIGFIDSTGKIVVKPSIDGILCAEYYGKEANLIPFYLPHPPANLGFIDQTGKIAIQPAFTFVDVFSEGLASFSKNSGDKRKGFIDKNGKIVIPAQFSLANPFYNGRAFVCEVSNYGYIDRNGKMVFRTNYIYDNRFSEGLAPVFSPDKHLAYADTNGNIVLKTPFEFGSHFSEGLALVIQGNKIGFIDKSGKLIIPCHFKANNGLQLDSYSMFHEGRCFVNSNGNNVIIDTLGNIISSGLEIQHFDNFSEGLAAVGIQGKTYYVDRRGEIAIRFPFLNGFPFSGGIAKVGISQKTDGYINRSGKVIFQYDVQ